MYTVKNYKSFSYNDYLSFELCGDRVQNFLVLTYKETCVKLCSPERLLDGIKQYKDTNPSINEIYFELTSECTRRFIDFNSKELHKFSEFVLYQYEKYYLEMYK